MFPGLGVASSFASHSAPALRRRLAVPSGPRAVWAAAVWAGGGVWADAGTPAATSGRARTAAVILRMRVGSSRCGERPCFRFEAGLYVTAALRRRVHLAFASAAVPIRPIHPRRAQMHLRVSPSEPNLCVDGRDGKRPVADHPERPQAVTARRDRSSTVRPGQPPIAAESRACPRCRASGTARSAGHRHGRGRTPRPSCFQGLPPAHSTALRGYAGGGTSSIGFSRSLSSRWRIAASSCSSFPSNVARSNSQRAAEPLPDATQRRLMKTIGYAAKGSPLLSQHFEALHDPRDAHRRALLRPATSSSRVS